MNNNTIIGVDLAKNVFQLHMMNHRGKTLKKKRVSRANLLPTLAKLPTSLVGIEACSGSNYWAREFTKLGHTVKIIAPQFVKPFVKSNKNDENDAEAIAEAVSRKNMRFVPHKSIEQQDMKLVHTSRELALRQRIAVSNHIRGILAEYGIFLKKGKAAFTNLLLTLEEASDKLTQAAKVMIDKLMEKYRFLEAEVKDYDKEIDKQARNHPVCKALQKIEGVGAKIATAAVATIGDGQTFKKGRECSAWLGLVPRQMSSGDKNRLGSISKRGDKYLRTLLIHGARSVVRVCDNKKDTRSLWVRDKKYRIGKNKAAVALANKNARIIWAIITSGEAYRTPELVATES